MRQVATFSKGGFEISESGILKSAATQGLTAAFTSIGKQSVQAGFGHQWRI